MESGTSHFDSSPLQPRLKNQQYDLTQPKNKNG
jgi:hypothetical protein